MIEADPNAEALLRKQWQYIHGAYPDLPAAVERAFLAVQRHQLIESYLRRTGEITWQTVEVDHAEPRPDVLEEIYSDKALITRASDLGVATSSSSQPSLVAWMLGHLDLRPGMKVLEIGTGSGYTAALIAEAIGDPAGVTTIDIDPIVVDQARRGLTRHGYTGIDVALGDGNAGVARNAPYDRIIVTAACPTLSPNWTDQLNDGGLIVVPLAHGGLYPLLKARRHGQQLHGRYVGWTRFVPIQGDLATQEPTNCVDQLARQGASAVKPLWEDLCGPIMTDFWFHLACVYPSAGRRALRSPDGQEMCFGYGIDQNEQRVLFHEREVLTANDRGLLSEISRELEMWRKLGRPTTQDYEVQFSLGSSPSQQAHTAEPHSWIRRLGSYEQRISFAQ